MEALENKTVHEYGIWKTKGYDDFIDEWVLMSSPITVLTIFAAYLLFVLKLGPDFMKNRRPYSLNNLLLMYNICQVALSVYVFQYGTRLLLKQGILDSICQVDRKGLEPLALGMWYYVFAKMTELLDTVFFVLRKKYNQVTFLHVYHHALMCVISWYALKYEPTYTIVFLGTLNTFVHIIMYSYYALSTFPALTKYLWWKKYITTMQLVQFCLIILQVTANTYISGCPPSYFILSVIYVNLVLMIYLFSDFYIKAYSNNKDNVKKDSIKTNVANSQKSSNIKFASALGNNNIRIHEKSQ